MTVAKPDFITYDSFSKMFMINTDQQADVGVYLITMSVTIPQIDPITGVNFV